MLIRAACRSDGDGGGPRRAHHGRVVPRRGRLRRPLASLPHLLHGLERQVVDPEGTAMFIYIYTITSGVLN